MSSDLFALIEPIFIVLVVFGFGFWQLRELNRLRREREANDREAAEAGDAPSGEPEDGPR